MLYLIATPIGNLADITYRAVQTLALCDYLLCEDTRHSQVLLSHYQIKKPLKSYHKFNEKTRENEVIADLKIGKKIGLLSDAGTPGIADPGMALVKRCREEGLLVTALPGPCAALLALSISGFDTTLFQFCGFLPKKKEERKTSLKTILGYPGTSLLYESPKRLVSTLELLEQLDSERRIGVGRELTKRYEELRLGTAKELLQHWETAPLKGEIVLVLEGETAPPIDWSDLTPKEHVALMQEQYGLSSKEAIKLVAELRQVPKRVLYKDCL